jgi:hypothetical protein
MSHKFQIIYHFIIYPFVQRQDLIQHYRSRYGGADLAQELKNALPPSEVATNQLFQALLDQPAVHDAKYLHKAMKASVYYFFHLQKFLFL